MDLITDKYLKGNVTFKVHKDTGYLIANASSNRQISTGNSKGEATKNGGGIRPCLIYLLKLGLGLNSEAKCFTTANGMVTLKSRFRREEIRYGSIIRLMKLNAKLALKELLLVPTTFFQLVSESLKAHMVGFSFLQKKAGIIKLMVKAKSDLLRSLLFQGAQLQNSDCIEVAQSMRVSNLDLGGAI